MSDYRRMNLQLFAGDDDPPVDPPADPPVADPPADPSDPAPSDPPEPEFELEPGQTVKLSDIKAWRQAHTDYQKLQPEYTRSRQQLTALQQQLAEEARLAEWARRLQADEELMAAVNDALAASGRPRLEDLPPEVQAAVKFAEQHQVRSRVEQTYSQAVEALGGLPDGFDEHAFWTSAAENGIPPEQLGTALSHAVAAHYRQQLADLPAKIAAAEKAGFDKAVAQFRQKGAAGIAAGTGAGGGTATPPAPGDKPGSYADIARQRLAAGGALFTQD